MLEARLWELQDIWTAFCGVRESKRERDERKGEPLPSTTSSSTMHNDHHKRNETRRISRARSKSFSPEPTRNKERKRRSYSLAEGGVDKLPSLERRQTKVLSLLNINPVSEGLPTMHSRPSPPVTPSQQRRVSPSTWEKAKMMQAASRQRAESSEESGSTKLDLAELRSFSGAPARASPPSKIVAFDSSMIPSIFPRASSSTDLEGRNDVELVLQKNLESHSNPGSPLTPTGFRGNRFTRVAGRPSSRSSSQGSI